MRGVCRLSGGSTPSWEVNPIVVECMREAGVDLSDSFPKPWTEEVWWAAAARPMLARAHTVAAALSCRVVQVARGVDIVITMGCGDQCPIVPSQRRVTWELEDPAGEGHDMIQRVMEECRVHVIALLEELCVPLVREP